MATWRARQRLNLVTFFVCCVFVLLFFRDSVLPSPNGSRQLGSADGLPGEGDVEMVVASMKKENLTWLDDYLLGWKKNIYVVDDPTAPLTVQRNKGRESMVFLT